MVVCLCVIILYKIIHKYMLCLCVYCAYILCVLNIFSSGYGSLPGSTRNSMIDTSLPPVPGHSNMYGSDSDIVHKSSPDTSPLAKKKWSMSGYRQSREEPNSWVSI